MQIILNESEIKQAIETHINSMGMCTVESELSISFTAGRGVSGNTATIEITPKESNPMAVSHVPEMLSDTQPAPAKPFDADDISDEEDVPFNTEPKDTKPVDFS